MEDEFRKVGLNSVTSSTGFTVEACFASAKYEDGEGNLSIYAEWGGSPTEILLYKGAYLKDVPVARLDAILRNVERAMKFLGHRVQILEDGERPK